MGKAKLKNLMILLLLLTNGLLIWLAMPLMDEEKNQQALAGEQLETLFATYGVTYDGDIAPQEQVLYTVELTMDGSDELPLATAILGEDVAISQESTQQTQVYQSEVGTLSISRDSTFTIQYHQEVTTTQMEVLVAERMVDLGVVGQIGMPVRQTAGDYVVTVTQDLFYVPYLSSQLDFHFEDGVLQQCKGNGILGKTQEDGSLNTGDVSFSRPDDQACMGYVDALVAFFASRNQLAWLGSSIDQVSQGFIRSDMASVAMLRLTPGWKIATDTGDFWVNGITGAVEPLTTSDNLVADL